MQAQPETGPRSGLEDVASLVGVEGMRRVGFTEDVDPAGVLGRGLQHRPRHKIDIPGPVLRILGRYHMGAQKGGLARELTSNLQCTHLVGNGQSVATLDLYSGRAESL